MDYLDYKDGDILPQNELKIIRKLDHQAQNMVCPILKQTFSEEDMVVDHFHTKHAKLLNADGGGHIRGVIHRQANSFEGKIVNSMIRLGLHKFDISLPELLRNIADYLERPYYPYIHPSEKPKQKKLKKQSYNTLKKIYDGRAKFPPYPKSCKITKPLQKLYDDYNIKPSFYA